MRSRSSALGRRRPSRSRPVIIWIAIVAVAAAGFYFLWSRGGEQPQSRVEKIIPPERLAQ